MADPIQILTPKCIDLGIYTIDALEKVSGLSIPTTKILRPTYGAHWSMPNNIFIENTAVGVCEANSDFDYNY